jgi:hypothetical protein
MVRLIFHQTFPLCLPPDGIEDVNSNEIMMGKIFCDLIMLGIVSSQKVRTPREAL